MARQILRIRDLGQSTFWQLMQMEGQPAPLTGKTALLLAADGADTQDVLEEFGYSEKEIELLYEKGVLRKGE